MCLPTHYSDTARILFPRPRSDYITPFLRKLLFPYFFLLLHLLALLWSFGMAQEAFFKICLPGPISRFPPTSTLRASPVASNLCTPGSSGIISDQKNHMYIKKSVAWISNVPSAYVVSSRNLTHSSPWVCRGNGVSYFCLHWILFLEWPSPLLLFPRAGSRYKYLLKEVVPFMVVMLWVGKGPSQETHWEKEQGTVLPLTCSGSWGWVFFLLTCKVASLWLSIPVSTFSGNKPQQMLREVASISFTQDSVEPPWVA